MKLATIAVEKPQTESEQRDGRLVIVDDQKQTVRVVPPGVAPNFLFAIRNWATVQPKLATVTGPDLPFSSVRFMAPLPRTTCWIDGSAYIQHIVLVRKARGAEPPEDLRTVPLMYQGVADPLLGPRDDILVAEESYGIDFEAEVGVILDEVPMGTRAKDAGQYIRFVCVMNDVSLRNLIPRELQAGFGFFHGKPPTSFAPFAITPDELGKAWKNGRVHLPMEVHLNGKKHGNPDAGEMFFSFPQLIQHAAKTRPLPAGTILGSGTVSNDDTSRGSTCLAETRILEIINQGEAKTPFMQFGDRIQIAMHQKGKSVFGDIDQKVVRYVAP